MAENGENLTSEQAWLFSEVESLVLSAIPAHCAGCSHAKFTPLRIANAVATESISRDSAERVANSFANCPGLYEEPADRLSAGGKLVQLCHFPGDTPPES